MNIKKLTFDNNKAYKYINETNRSYFFSFEDYSSFNFGITEYDKNSNTAKEILIFPYYFITKNDIVTNKSYCIGGDIINISIYEITPNPKLIISIPIRSTDCLIDFYCIDSNIFIFFKAESNDELSCILIDKDKKISQINDDIIKNAIDVPIVTNIDNELYFFIQCPNFKDLSIYEIFQYVFFKTDQIFFNNDIYYIKLNSLISSIKLKIKVLYNKIPLPSKNKLMSLLNIKKHTVYIFSYENNENFINIFSINDNAYTNKIKTNYNVIIHKKIFNKSFYFGYNKYGEEIILDSNFNEIYRWEKEKLLSSYEFSGYFEKRYFIFSSIDIFNNKRIYNIYDSHKNKSFVFNCNFLIINDKLII